jgi:hypothetical protein
MKPTVMHCVYEERVVNGVVKRRAIAHSINKEKAYAAINEWREKEQRLNEAEESLRLFELQVEEGALNREYGIYYCNWIVYNKEAYEALRARKHRTGRDCGHAFK